MVFFLIYGTNRLDKHHFENVQYIMDTVYEDRIVAQHYIYQLSNLYRQKMESFPASLNETAGKDINRQIEEYIQLFSSTKLTSKEAQVFQLLEKNDQELRTLEANLASMPDDGLSEEHISRFRAKADMVFENLDGLSDIQLNEGGRLRNIAQDSLDTNSFFSQLELFVLVFIGLLVQAIIFFAPKAD